MNFKITITEVIANKNDSDLVISKLRQLGITQFTIEEYIPEKKVPVQKEQYTNEQIEPIIDELEETMPITLLKKLSSEY
jgi:transcriptional/translational regulatory protein YebC/TACO1